MVNLKENIWLFLILGGILGIISLFTATLYISSEDALIWVWNLYISSYHVGFVQTDEILFTIGLISTAFITIGTLITLLSGIFSKVKNKPLNILAIIGGLLILISPIYYLVVISIVEENIWEYFSINIGSFLPFFAGAIPILVGVIDLVKRKS